MTTPILTHPAEERNLHLLQANAEEKARAVSKQVRNLRGQLMQWDSNPCGHIPAKITQLVMASRLLNQAVQEIQRTSMTPVAAEVIQTLDDSLALIQRLAARIDHDKFIKSPLDPRSCYLDDHRLLLSDSTHQPPRLPTTHAEWYMNLGLLMNVYQRTQNLDLKKEIAFLVIHYLGKVAPYGFEELSLPTDTKNTLNHLFHHGFLEPGISYNRESPIFDPFLLPEIFAITAPGSGNQTFVVGKQDICDLLPLWFSMVQTDEKNLAGTWSKEIKRLIGPHLKQILADDFANYIDPPLLIDLTALLGPYLYCTDDEKENAPFKEKLDSTRDQLNKAIARAAHTFISENPDAFDSPAAKQRLIAFLRSSMIGICRGEIKNAGFVKLVPLYEDPNAFDLPQDVTILRNFTSSTTRYARQLVETNIIRAQLKFKDFINGTGVRMTSIEGRRALLDVISLEKLLADNHHAMVFYAPHGPNAQLYPSPSSIIETHLFRRFERRLTDQQLLAQHPYLQVLGISTLKLVKGLVEEIGGKKWRGLNRDPDKRLLLQNSMYRFMQHLAKAENHLLEFGKFTQAIELVHCEMAALLHLCSPFSSEDFEPIYLQQLQWIPEKLRPFVKAGLTKSSMNTFSGVNAALRQMSENPYRVFQPDAHFEIVQSMSGSDETFEEAIGNTRSSVELYLCEFNHNVNLDPAHNEYRTSDVIGEVEALLKSKPDTKHLTVAVDCTIDFSHSDKVYALLSRFSKQIRKGKLNFVFFRSGQKFDMLGMDHYYGSPFYMVNNGDVCWQPFDRLITHPVHQTDLLSTQWFCLVNKYAPGATDDHRRAIFENSALILANIPESLKPGNPTPVKVCTVEEGMDTCFIDLKVTGKEAGQLSESLVNRLCQKFAAENARIHARGGYGFLNPNVCYFQSRNPDVKGGTIRINPGIDRFETQLLIEFLNHLINEN